MLSLTGLSLNGDPFVKSIYMYVRVLSMFSIRLFSRELTCQETQFDVYDVNISHQHQFLSEALQWRAQTDPDHVLYVLLNAKVGWSHTTTRTRLTFSNLLRVEKNKAKFCACNSLISPHVHSPVICLFVPQGVPVCTATCAQLHKRAEKITATLMERGGLNTGDNVVLLYPPGERTALSPLCLFLPSLRLHVFCAQPRSLPSLRVQASIWSLPSTAACTPASSPSPCGRLTLRTWRRPFPPSAWSSTWVRFVI